MQDVHLWITFGMEAVGLGTGREAAQSNQEAGMGGMGETGGMAAMGMILGKTGLGI